MISHFPNLLFGHPRYVVCGHNKSVCDGTSSYDQSIYVQPNLYLYHVSNLKFLSKVIEKVAATRLTDCLRENDLNECLQFAYKKHHISETALPRVLNDILKSIDNKQCVVLLLLDLSAAFDTVNRKILLHRLRSRFVVNKFKSKLKTFLFKGVYEVSSVFILHFCNYVRIICK